MAHEPPFNLLLVSDRDEALVQPGEVTPLDGDVEAAWLPLRCGSCEAIVLARGQQRGMADVDMTASAHRATCGDCGQRVTAEVTYLQEGYRTWQPLANPDVEEAEPIFLADLAERVHAREA